MEVVVFSFWLSFLLLLIFCLHLIYILGLLPKKPWLIHLSKSSPFFSLPFKESPRYCLANVRRAFSLFYASGGVGFLNPLLEAVFVHPLFLLVKPSTSFLTEANQACSSLDVVLGSCACKDDTLKWQTILFSIPFCELTDELLIYSWSIFGRPANPNKVPCFINLWIMALIVGRWNIKGLKIAR